MRWPSSSSSTWSWDACRPRNNSLSVKQRSGGRETTVCQTTVSRPRNYSLSVKQRPVKQQSVGRETTVCQSNHSLSVKQQSVCRETTVVQLSWGDQQCGRRTWVLGGGVPPGRESPGQPPPPDLPVTWQLLIWLSLNFSASSIAHSWVSLSSKTC